MLGRSRGGSGGLVEPTQYFTIIFLVKKRPVEYLQSQLHLDNVGDQIQDLPQYTRFKNHMKMFYLLLVIIFERKTWQISDY